MNHHRLLSQRSRARLSTRIYTDELFVFCGILVHRFFSYFFFLSHHNSYNTSCSAIFRFISAPKYLAIHPPRNSIFVCFHPARSLRALPRRRPVEDQFCAEIRHGSFAQTFFVLKRVICPAATNETRLHAFLSFYFHEVLSLCTREEHRMSAAVFVLKNTLLIPKGTIKKQRRPRRGAN